MSHNFPTFVESIRRFWAMVQKSEDANGCWIWTGAKDKDGYGQFTANCVPFKAHRVSYEIFVGSIPEDLVPDHTCKNPSCVNPKHLEPVTIRVNTLRGTSVAARFAIATHCKNGHAFTTENTMIRAEGGRRCRTCHNANNLKSAEKRRAKAREQ